MALGPLAYLLAFATSAVLALVLTPLALRVAVRLGVLDNPGDHKAHASPVPYLGGAAIAASCSAAVLLAAAVSGQRGSVPELAVVIGLAMGLALLGLVDDLRGLGASLRLGAEVAAAIALWATGSGVALFAAEPANLVVTVAWVVGVTNAFNLLDNMDGLSAGIAGIAAGFFLLIAALNGQFLVAALAATVAGCALGFLRHNFHPARIYMGDAGSLYLGFLLAYLGMKLRFAGPTSVTGLVPIFVLGVALFDTALVSVCRLRHRRNPLLGGRDHTSHRLVFLGIPVPAAVSLIYAAGVTGGYLGLVVSRLDVVTAWLLAGLAAAIAVLLGVLLGVVPVYENSRARRMMMIQAAAHEAPEETVELASAGDLNR